jgi:hypothetical protein
MEIEMRKAEEDYQKQLDDNRMLEETIERKERESENLALEILETEGKYLKEKDDPVRLEKNNESIL